MPSPRPEDVTRLLREWGAGHPESLELLIPLVYDELRAIASRRLSRERPGHTLQTTGLVHEAYLRFSRQRPTDWQNRGHFFAVAARLMRWILVDHARRRRGRGTLVIEVADKVAPAPGVDIMALHEALTRLEAADPQLTRVVELRFFGGLTVEETAEATGVSPATVKREWSAARAWLHQQLVDGKQAR